MPDDQPLVVAEVLGAVGLRGDVKCRVITDFPERFEPGMRILVGEALAANTVTAVRWVQPHVVLHLAGVDDRSTAEALRGAEILVRAEDAVQLPEGQFFWRQVIGLRVETPDGTPLGTVEEILPTAANDVYVVRGPEGEMLVPAVKEIVLAIEPEQGRMVVQPLPGMTHEPPPRRREKRPPRRRPRPTVS